MLGFFRLFANVFDNQSVVYSQICALLLQHYEHKSYSENRQVVTKRVFKIY